MGDNIDRCINNRLDSSPPRAQWSGGDLAAKCYRKINK